MLFQSALTLESIFSPNFFNQHVTPQWVQRLAFELVYMQRYPDLAQRLVGAFKSCVTLMVCAHVLFVGQHHGQAQQQRKQSRLQHKQQSSWAHHRCHRISSKYTTKNSRHLYGHLAVHGRACLSSAQLQNTHALNLSLDIRPK
jgi:hypothetical protein